MAYCQEWEKRLAVCFGKLVNVVRWGEARRIRIRIQKPRDLCAFKALNGKQVHEVQSALRNLRLGQGGRLGLAQGKLAINFANKSFNYINLTHQIWACFFYRVSFAQIKAKLLWFGPLRSWRGVGHNCDCTLRRVRQLKIISKAGICAHFATLARGRHKILSYYAHKRLK